MVRPFLPVTFHAVTIAAGCASAIYSLTRMCKESRHSRVVAAEDQNDVGRRERVVEEVVLPESPGILLHAGPFAHRR